MLDIKSVNLRSESEIMADWIEKDLPIVSIICHTFQQEAYIEDAIISFLMQETKFAFEIIIHDDASIDRTPKIIQSYQTLYPNIIFPILQTENQYSKNKKPSSFTFKKARGRYIALCEGDDYWIDKNKLQRQFVALEKYSDIKLSIHDAYTVNQNDGAMENRFPPRNSEEQIVPFAEIFSTTGQFSPTASMMFRVEVVKSLPDFFSNAPIGDFFLEVFGGRAGVHYLPQKMSVYRSAAMGSWSNRVLENTNKKIEMYYKYLHSLCDLEKYLNEDEAYLVKYKRQIIYYSLALSYLDKKEISLSLWYFFKSLKGKVRFTYNILFILELIGINQVRRKTIKRFVFFPFVFFK